MSRRAQKFAHLKGNTIEETQQNILRHNSIKASSTGKTSRWEVESDGHLKRLPGTKFGLAEEEYKTQLGNTAYRMVPTVLTCTRPMNPAKALRIAATLHKVGAK